MLFNSLIFAIFFPIVTLGYFVLPQRARWSWLLLASCYFYMFFVPVYILILFFTIGIDYVAGLAIASATGPRRRTYLLLSLVANVGVLAFFKYYNFLNDTFASPLPHLDILLPIGLSFHTFQSMSYTIEVYRGHQPPERNLGIFALYVMFYPQLVAGPIERPQNLLHQFHEHHRFDGRRFSEGLRLMLWGLFKKVVIADRLAACVDAVYNNPPGSTPLALGIATYFFTFQIYCDFSGYSDIARGCARVMGFDLMVNFRRPYLSRSISEFWRRWHVSLSTWFKDYLYVPLGGNRVSTPRRALNLVIVFLVSGLWHGANWTFVAWGALHGAYLVCGMMMSRLTSRLRLPGLAQTFVVFHLAAFAWIFFRARNLTDARYIATHLGAGGGFSAALTSLATTRGDFLFACALVSLLVIIERIAERTELSSWFAGRPTWQRWTLYYVGVLAIVFLGAPQAAQFIYFQF